MIDLMQKLEKKLSEFEGFEGWVIGKVLFQIEQHGEFCETGKKLLRQNSKMAVMEVYEKNQDYCGKMNVTLFYPDKKEASDQPFVEEREESFEKAQMFCFSQKKVDHYLEITGDSNPIHKGENAIVPGFLMINQMMERCLASDMKSINGNVRFYKPVFVERELFAEQEQGIWKGFQRKEVCFVMKFSVN